MWWQAAMRMRVDVTADVPSLRWEDVHGPARGVVYGLIGEHDPALAKALHDEGWRGRSLKPVGVTSPQFKGAPHKKGVYTTSPEGSVWFGSPVPEIASALVAALAARTEIVWGTARLQVRGFAVDFGAPAAVDGVVELVTATPVVIRHEGRDLLPGDERFVERMERNLAHKADVLGLPAPGGLKVLEAGPRRRFSVRGAPRIGAQVRVALEADPRFVEALWSWGLGLDTVQGFGWIR
ncbi:CRISPR-associated endoribonuclease Cas6 [Streptomyces sp. G7(2002)]|uniref:CRISPR-associated endoribonuclease Cas6 n=1 Tax=Streptomyces sp. G7(2002) TaxID=2971798 RepID=UPI00237DD96E|nr:CRISPR-associated endoribonuclease Cas6 [Streptomyces sp. G7(2002)]WDT53542.1 CRISPR-associated endoribonuclease Cas6 [Streptomyces sp. G7(2002)]